ncbi:type III-B CRISPR module-associated Cmr3 family protein [Crocosphaera sp. XPORK-15E]|uniref:type III-B CRISPR module-associated Cmr3 family protein n=1 Tax=Crocosphaera sp. XPORK-15E TaxID=3110247 RepID=UPI002B2022A4|nr:type III-B CRISPR module-associated Cmr3 family protein [Crocosphaera sp. XPORK-15E]MEA5537046.1 type III-B CRISPR module-associated Cmr3 family protein [Crocosphaera sp. XPORK-15E]
MSKTVAMNPAFNYLIIIEPLGLLYGSAGGFLSPENLVGLSREKFPPSAATVSGLFAASLGNEAIQKLRLAGPFWGKIDQVFSQVDDPKLHQNFYVPTPFTYVLDEDTVDDKLVYNDANNSWMKTKQDRQLKKNEEKTWIAIANWKTPIKVEKSPWEFCPHLHPKLEPNERRVKRINNQENDPGSLFLENAVQMEPDTCLVYLSNLELESNMAENQASKWYRFGGEGHIVDVSCIPLNEDRQTLLQEKIQNQFALITPGVWGSNRLSYREPIELNQKDAQQAQQLDSENNSKKVWEIKSIYTKRPQPFRYRLGNSNDPEQTNIKRLSRGRYAVPAGTVYVLNQSLNQSWQEWPESWFPKEGPSLKRWGCGLALPLLT